MRTRWIFALGAAAVVAGCATSSDIERGAYAHQQKAQLYSAHGDYSAAAREQQAADKQFAKAQRRAYDEAYNRAYWY
jgi:outer membrane murein-binding lipoprotein Lpp